MDPTILDALEHAGYADSREAQPPADLAEALAATSARRSAEPCLSSCWREINRARSGDPRARARDVRPAAAPAWPAHQAQALHKATTLVTLGLIAAHGGVLLLDGYLRPGLAGVTLPFALGYRPFWTGLGVIGGWLVLILAGSFYVRGWIGVKTWRWLHRWTLAVYVLALAHVIGAGTDGAHRGCSPCSPCSSPPTSSRSPTGCFPPCQAPLEAAPGTH